MKLYSDDENYKLYHGSMLDMAEVIEPESIDIKNYYGFIYIVINKLNGKMYIGKKKFVSNWRTYLGSGLAIKLAIVKYGKENFNRIIIDLARTSNELSEKEIYYINKYDAVNSTLFYNEAKGGIGGDTFSGRTIESQEKTRKKLGHKGNKHPFYNKHHNKQTRDKIRESTGKKVLCVETRKIYKSTREIEEVLNFHHENISACCRGKISQSNGFHWKYVEM